MRAVDACASVEATLTKKLCCSTNVTETNMREAQITHHSADRYRVIVVVSFQTCKLLIRSLFVILNQLIDTDALLHYPHHFI